MSRRSKKTLSVALFPFLAVLVCTMGSLIFLLLVTTRQIRDRALAQAQAEALAATPALPLLSVSQPEPITIPELIEAEPEADPRELERVQHAAALEERERELNELLAQWRQKANDLAAQREDKAKGLAQRRALQDAAARQIASLQQELRDQESQLKKLTGELSASPSGDATLQERRQIEQEIAALQKRLRAAQVAEAGGNSKFMVVPFDAHSGTSRRPILIECTADGLRFLPEDIVIRPDDLEGFTPRVNPLLAGSNSLVSYWTAWNLKQPQPAREPEPYVLMLVRPSGTVAYYIAMKMLTTLKQPHGYELIEEETQLQMPELDAGAKATCEAAVKRLLAERDQIKKFAGGGSGIAGFARGGGSKGDAFRAGGTTGSTGGKSGNRFDVTDVTEGEDEVGSRSWERIENFAGRNPRRQSGAAETAFSSEPSGSPVSSGASSRSGSTTGRQGALSSSPNDADEVDEPGGLVTGGSKFESTGEQSSISNGRPSGRSGQLAGRTGESPARGANGSSAQTGPTREGSTGATAADSGIESLEAASDSGGSPGLPRGPAASGRPLDTGLGSNGSMPIAVEDRRTKNKSANSKPLEPEQFTRKRWGLSAPDAAIGLEREVSVDVEAQRLVVAGKHAIRMGEGESKQETFERLVTVLDLQARDWGQPPQGFYWTPSLRFVVADGGSSNYELAKSLAERAGLATSKQFASDRNSADRNVKPSNAAGEELRSSAKPSSSSDSPLSPAAPRRVPGAPVLPPSPAVRGGTP